MDAMLLRMFQRVVAEQSGFALTAAREVDNALARMDGLDAQMVAADAHRRAALRDAGGAWDARIAARTTNTEEFNRLKKQHQVAREALWFWLQSLLANAGNVSKCLWPNERRPTRDVFSDRGLRLRESLDVPDHSPIANRALRNHLEHIDERLEKWWRDAEEHNIARRNIGPLDEVRRGLKNVQQFEHFDPEQRVVAFHGDVFELPPLIEALASLNARAVAIAPQPWWENEASSDS